MAEVVKVTGLRELLEAMRQLPREMDRPILNSALMAGAVPIRDEARRRAPVLALPDPRRRAGTLARSIVAIPLRTPARYAAEVIVRVRSLSKGKVRAFKKSSGLGGASNPDDPFYWRFVELGTSKKAARPFLRPAFESQKRGAIDLIKGALGRALIAAALRVRPR